MTPNWLPVTDHLDLVADPVAAALRSLAERRPDSVADILVAPIDPEHADTEAMTELWGTDLSESVNCVVVAGKRAGEERVVACAARATTRVDVNHTVKKRLDVRKCSFMSMDAAVERTGMEYGGITPLELPKEWQVWIDPAVLGADAIIGSGLRSSKIRIPGDLLAELDGIEVVDGLAG